MNNILKVVLVGAFLTFVYLIPTVLVYVFLLAVGRKMVKYQDEMVEPGVFAVLLMLVYHFSSLPGGGKDMNDAGAALLQILACWLVSGYGYITEYHRVKTREMTTFLYGTIFFSILRVIVIFI